MLEKVVFLDRDGVINFDSPDYIKSCAEFEFIPGSIEAIRRLTASGFTSIVVTNQSALARNLISAAELDRLHTMMKKTIASGGGRVTDIFWCPHLPGDGCDCRKPAPGLIYQAQRKYDIDLTAAVMVGDSAKDIECARRAGVHRAVLVQSGAAHVVERQLKARQMLPDYVAGDLLDAVKWILQGFRTIKRTDKRFGS